PAARLPTPGGLHVTRAGCGTLDPDTGTLPAPAVRAGRERERRRGEFSDRGHGRRLDLDAVGPVGLKKSKWFATGTGSRARTVGSGTVQSGHLNRSIMINRWCGDEPSGRCGYVRRTSSCLSLSIEFGGRFIRST